MIVNFKDFCELVLEEINLGDEDLESLNFLESFMSNPDAPLNLDCVG